MSASARFAIDVYLWKPEEFPQHLDDQITSAFEEAEELLRKRLHELDEVKEVRSEW